MPELITEFEYSVDLTGVADAGPGPFGQRLITNVTGGQFTGDRLNGTIVPPGADWLCRPGRIRPARHPSNVQDSRRSADLRPVFRPGRDDPRDQSHPRWWRHTDELR